MLARLRTTMAEKDEGFTLIELLVVIIIIGILAAIAIPVFLNQRQKGVDASLKADLKSSATAMETYYTDNSSYPAVTASTAIATKITDVKLSPGNAVTIESVAGGAFCLKAANPDASSAYYYNSGAGGLLPKGTTCT